MTDQKRAADLLQGTLDMLILKVLDGQVLHGFDIAERILRLSDDVLRAEEGALYPALHRLEARNLISAVWRPSDNNRRAKFYGLTAAGRKQLEAQRKQWERFSDAVALVLRDA